MKFILGTKVGMTQIFDSKGHAHPVTLIQAGPVAVTQVLGKDKVGYNAIQIGYGKKRLNKPERGHVKDFAGASTKGFAILREVKNDGTVQAAKGDILDVGQFEMGERVNVSGITKAKGFQGVVKRWGFAGGPKTHGQKHSLRAPGSIGSGHPQRVVKGLRMGGRMGGVRRTTLNLKVAYIDKDDNIIGVKGAIPGNTGAFVEIFKK